MKFAVVAAAYALLIGFQVNGPSTGEDAANRRKLAAAETVAAASVPQGEWRDGPRGLYYMQWYDVVSRSLERHVYFFEGDHYLQDPSGEGGGLDMNPANARSAGRWSLAGDRMTMAADQGQPRTAQVRPEAGTGCFEFDDGVWCPVRPFSTAALDGAYSGGSSYTSPFGSAATASDYLFSPDGTYRALFAGSFNDAEGTADGRVTGAGSAQGRYRIEGLSLSLVADDGTVQEGIAFPFGENIDGPRPSHIFFAGRMLSRSDH